MQGRRGRILLTIFLSVFAIVVLFGAVLAIKVARYARAFQMASGTSLRQLTREVRASWNIVPEQDHGKVTFLVLGVDQVAGRTSGEQGSMLTDSIMLATLDMSRFRLTQLSLPRDLWLQDYRTKINALYFYGSQRTPENPTLFPQVVVQEITGVPTQHVVIINLETVAQIIDALGGVDIEIERSFVDEEFPRSGVDVATVHDPQLLFERVEFIQGVEHMDGARALIFIRSRHSKDLVEGTDEARILRQQKVLQAMMAKLFSPSILRDPQAAGRLYALYKAQFAQSVPFDQVVGIMHTLANRVITLRSFPGLSIQRSTLSIRNEGNEGVLYHPNPRLFGGQWVYVPVDPTWSGVKQEIQGFYEKN